MKTKLRILAVVIILALAGYGAQRYFKLGRGVADGRVRVSGNIETTEAQVAFKIAGRVKERFYDEGQSVEIGKPVATLDTDDLQCNVELRRAELAVAKAGLAALLAGSRVEEIAAAKAAWERAVRSLADLEAGSRPQEIAVARAAVEAAAADKNWLDADLNRVNALFNRRAVSAEEHDRAKAAYDVAVAKHRQAIEQLKLAEEGFRREQIEQARAAAAQAKAQYDLVLAGPRKEDIDQGRARVAQAEAALKLAETQLGYATVYAPLTGMVLSKNIEPGEYVAPGTAVVTVGDLKHVWLRGYIEALDLERVKLDAKATITTDSGSTFVGRVSFIAQTAEFTPKNVQTQKERVRLVYRIKIDIDNKDMKLKPGMPADAVIETRG